MARAELAADTLKVIRVFLASPSDLGVERHIAREAVTEINRTVARPAGFHVDLIGWEDTISAAGRPQAIINEDLETCQVFIGMLWSRWGTPPAHGGAYGSGFEEEYSLAVSRNASNGQPHITLLFKDVEPSKINDPGPELSRVLQFKQEIISDKSILFDTFDTPDTFARKIRLTLADYLHRLRTHQETRQDSGTVLQPENDLAAAALSTESVGESQSIPETAFLDSLATCVRLNEAHAIPPVTIARLRNFALSLGDSSNDQSTIGPHDANLIFASRSDLNLSTREISALADAGLAAWVSENAPLWCWLQRKFDTVPEWLFYSTVGEADRIKIGAFRALSALEKPIPFGDFFSKDNFDEWWFGSEIDDKVKSAALDYISTQIDDTCLNLAQTELGRNSYGTRSSALEAVLSILSKRGARQVAEFAVGHSFDQVSQGALNSILAGMEELDSDRLTACLEHRHGPIRCRALRTLSNRGHLELAQAKRFFGDTHVPVRVASVEAYEGLGAILTEDEAKAALVVESKSSALGGNFDSDGNDAFTAYRRRKLSKRKPIQLLNNMGGEPLSSDDFYFASVISNVRLGLDRLRHDFDDRFVRYWTAYLDRVQSAFDREGTDVFRALVDKHQSFSRRKLMRSSLDILVNQQDRQDLARIRKAIDDKAVDLDSGDARYFGKFGEWEDIERIQNLENYLHKGGLLGALYLGSDRSLKISDAVISIAKNRIAEFLTLSVNYRLSVSVLARLPRNKIKSLGTEFLTSLLFHEDERLRKVTAIRIVQTFSANSVKRYLDTYITSEMKHYYNVVFWLDLGASFNLLDAQKVISKEIERLGL